MERELLIWLWHGLTNDLIRIRINSDVLRNSIGHGEHDTIQYWNRREDYTDEQPIDAA
jgi:hypothetical protein